MTTLDIIIFLFIFGFGAIIGSFLNVVIYRYNTGMGIGGRSKCFTCGKKLTWMELVPLASYVIQGGRCKSRECKARISPQYPIVEFVTGLFFVYFLGIYASPLGGVVAYFDVGLLLVITGLLIAIAVYDFRHKIIPDGLVYGFIAAAFMRMLISTISLGTFSFGWLVAGIVLALPFAAIWYFSKGKWMGFGDAKLAVGIGYLLGISHGFTAIILAFWIGAIVGLVYLYWPDARSTIKSEIPFAPFLILGLFIVLMSGFDLIHLDILLGSL